ncbi:MAG: 16S rRNA (cytidine(1402)-2'-O)-methyltransferase [Defluviitaleaceae bacterium]|nr:16S rRNA (cytidine(1402)-2'-O)-methyltransferase [Defluviitaleaceae bacterium]MCL2239150.1 16S rRNA (cytidine(1402)-2'-O)-methyltransferase [Defluviitaleaceae bacterium]
MRQAGGGGRGTLYVVATPIGNLGDMTPRGVRVLSEADMAAAEDTRHSRALFAHFGIKTPLFSCHGHNEEKRGDFFIRALQEGKSVALLSDAGTPCISDPGHRLIGQAAAAGIEIVPICGPSAVIAALSISGLDASRFAFLGFWPRKKAEQAAALEAIAAWGSPVAFYESPRRIAKTLLFLSESDPDMEICLCNDLTKKFERVYRGTPAEVAAQLAQNPAAEKGEYTCVALPSRQAQKKEPPASTRGALSLEAQLVDIMATEGCDLKTAAARLHALAPKQRKKEIYAATLRVKAITAR